MIKKVNITDNEYEILQKRMCDYMNNTDNMNSILGSKLIQSKNLTTEIYYLLNFLDLVLDRISVKESLFNTNIFNRINTFAKIDEMKNLRTMALDNRKGINLLKKLINIDDDGKIDISDTLVDMIGAAMRVSMSEAEKTLEKYFDDCNFVEGVAISREGARKFQAHVLKDLFLVSGVKVTNGAALFNGRILTDSTQSFIEQMNEKLNTTGISQEVDYILLMNDRSFAARGFENGLIDSVANTLDGIPALIVFPIEWKSNAMVKLNDKARSLRQLLLSGVAAVSSLIFAANCFHLFPFAGPFSEKDHFSPIDSLYLAIVPIAIHNFASAVEIYNAKLKGITTSHISLPAFTLPSYGTRVAYHSLPKNRQDLFDVSAIGFFTSIVTSSITFLVGMQLTASASPEVLDTFPTIQLQSIKFNAIITQLLNFQFPNLFNSVISNPSTVVHLHWVAIAGIISFMAQCLHLLPVDNTVGSKMTFAVLGIDAFKVFSTLVGTAKIFYLVYVLISFGISGEMLLATQIFTYFLLCSQMVGDTVSQ